MPDDFKSSLAVLIVKFLIVGLIAFSTSYLSNGFSEPPPSEMSKKYNEEYRHLTRKPLSSEEFVILQKKGKEYIERLTSPENISDSVQYIILRKLMIVPFISLLWFFLGLKIGFVSKERYGVSILVIAVFSLFSINILETLIYVSFFIIGGLFSRNKIEKNRVEF